MNWEDLPIEDQEGLQWLFQGWSGKFGNRVFYQRNGITRMRKAPRSHNKTATPKQAVTRAALLAANQFAKNAMNDPQLKAYYESIAVPPCNAFNAAVSDYFKKKKSESRSTVVHEYCAPCCWAV